MAKPNIPQISNYSRVYFTYNRQNFTPTLKSFTDTQTTFFLFLPHNICFYAYLEHLLPISFLKKGCDEVEERQS